LKVVKVKYLNLDLNLLSKDLGVKLGWIIENYKALMFSKFHICFVKIMSF
jgi:hypothetical protein